MVAEDVRDEGAVEGAHPSEGRATRGEREVAAEGAPAKKRAGGPKTPAGRDRVRRNPI